MICFLAGVFHFISGIQILIYTLLTFYYNDTPQLHYEQRENFVNASGIIGNSSNGIAWFIHCSDMHIGKYPYLADYIKSYFDEVIHDLVKPFVEIWSKEELVQKASMQHLNGNYIRNPFIDLNGNHASIYQMSKEIMILLESHITSLMKILFQYMHLVQKKLKYSFVLIDAAPDPGTDLSFSIFGGFNRWKTKSYQKASQYEQLQSELSKPDILDSDHVFLVSHYTSPSLNMDTRHNIQKILKQGKFNENDELHRRNIWGFLTGHIHNERMDSTRNQRRYVEAQVAAMLESQLFRIYVIDNDMLPPIIYGAITNPPNVMQITQRVPHYLVKNSTHIRALIFSQSPIINCWVDILAGVDDQTKWLMAPQLSIN
ncbi:MAG: hypothetical protein EZS28_011454 [Streblomastix strix]|uniref:Calcineurin-like phosphoesterase domain-containing protein n=1 Tax=Streblomastix strix TaxID=222440 RepID=A0A5J4WFA2_9EUKA|nr:MAG: hypothetical protein EZS28_011454 [Streblomastix strix]